MTTSRADLFTVIQSGDVLFSGRTAGSRDESDFAQAIPVLSDKVVNVASVPQRSPLRYPGGKTWLVPARRKS